MSTLVFEQRFGRQIEPNELVSEMAASVARLLLSGEFPYARFVQAFRGPTGAETIKFEVDVERPQRPVTSIAFRELIAAMFIDDQQPLVYALRPGFPTEALHLYLGGASDPPWLCLDDRLWVEIKVRWTAFRFIERVRWWLAATARGDLHGEVQPAEPVFAASLGVVIPADLATANWEGRRLTVHAVYDEAQPHTIVLREGNADNDQGTGFVPMFFRARPQIMQRSRWAPQNVKELDDLLQSWGVDLVDSLRDRIRGLQSNSPSELKSRPLIVLQMPLLNADGSPSEQADLKAFSTYKEWDLARLGIELGIFYSVGDSTVACRVVPRILADAGMCGENVPIRVLSVHFSFSRAAAASGSGLPVDTRAVVLIGAGAIGSHLIEIMRRDGFGTWAVVDNDAFLPHNVQRHRGAEGFVGAAKAKVTAEFVNWAVGTPNETRSACSDVLANDPECEALLAAAALIIDASASIPVARSLSDRRIVSAPRLSVFFNAVGRDVVLLGEDVNRKVMLDAVEAQYYRAALDIARLSNHIAETGTVYHYAGACRAVSVQMPEHQVSMLTGAIAGEIRRHLEGTTATITIWSGSADEGLRRHAIPVFPVDRLNLEGWEIVIDEGINALAKRLRAKALPSETGGILLGTIDIPRRQICVVKLVPAPSDSFGDRQGFERGTRNLAAVVADASKRTAGQVEYVGEWHSHPKSVKPNPSDIDLKQLVWLGTERRIEGLPALMMIVGEKGDYSIHMAIPV